VLLFWYLIGETEEMHEKTKAPGSEVKIWDRTAVYPHSIEHVECFSYMKRANMFVIAFFLPCRNTVEGSVCKNKAVRGRGFRCSKVTEYDVNMTHVACWPWYIIITNTFLDTHLYHLLIIHFCAFEQKKITTPSWTCIDPWQRSAWVAEATK
jgi:hypothetical protein